MTVKYIPLILFLFNSYTLFSQSPSNNKLKSEFELLYNKSIQFQSKNIDSSLYFSETALNKAIKLKDTFNIIKSNYFIGKSLRRKSNFEASKKHFYTVIKLSPSINDKYFIRNAYTSLGIIEEYQNNNYNEAINFYKKALSYSETKLDQLHLQNNISGCLYSLGQKEIAKQYLIEALNYLEGYSSYNDKLSLDEKTQLVIMYNNLSNYEEPQDGIKQLHKVLNIVKTDSALFYNLPLIYSNLGAKFAKLKLKDSTYFYLEKAFFKGSEANIEEEVLINSLLLSLEALRFKDYYKSQAFLDTLFKYNPKKNNVILDINIDSLAFEVFRANHNYKQANLHAYYYIKFLDSLRKNDREKHVLEFAKKYETDKKIQENKLLKSENLIKNLEVDKQKTTRNYLILFFAMGLVMLAIIYRRYSAKKQTALTLEKQNTIINQQKEELEKRNANKQKLFGIIAHDLINPFNAILGYTQLLEEDYNNFTDAERKEFISTINKYANSNYNLTRTLLDWAKVQQDKLVVNKVLLNCKQLVENTLQPYKVLAEKKNIHITLSIPENITVKADTNIMQTVIGNLFVNAIKFTPQGGKIKFCLEKNDNGTIKLEIEDNGIGMTQEQLNNLFDITKVTTVKGTNQEKGNGLGLILCKELMELQKGSLQMFSKLNKGSKAVVTI